jgi:hypothetical protein
MDIYNPTLAAKPLSYKHSASNFNPLPVFISLHGRFPPPLSTVPNRNSLDLSLKDQVLFQPTNVHTYHARSEPMKI